MLKYKRIIAGLLVLCLAGCSSLDGDPAGNTRQADEEIVTSLVMAEDAEGNLNIERLKKDYDSSTEEGWTIFVYMCGSDLESENGMATMDLIEMEEASTGSNVRFVIQTGGSYQWYCDVDPEKNQRYEITDGEATLIEESELTNMGEISTLADFVKWGVEEYPAPHMGLIMWDHGGGSISGICSDECFDYDTLTLREMDAALLSAYHSTNESFDFIGFDACLMATIECANVCANYANYLIASEETESGYGWDYTSIGNYLGQNPGANGAEVGEVIADSYYASCYGIGKESDATLSVIDLSRLDDLLVAFNTYSKELYESTDTEKAYVQVARNANSADNFGGNNKTEGYTNMVDLSGLIDAGKDYTECEDDVKQALDDAVVYIKNGENHKDAGGLSIYYPLKIQESGELETLSRITVSSYYLSFVDRVAYSASSGEAFGSYDNTQSTEGWGTFSYNDNYEETDDTDYFSYYDDYEITGESLYITFEKEPLLDEDGYYGFQLTEDALSQALGVQGNVFQVSDDGEDLIDLGTTLDINADWDTGEFYDNFDGYWFSLPDGQNLEVYLVSECDGYDIYTSPVELNGEETNLRITFDYTNEVIAIDGVWAGIDDNGMAGDIYRIEDGDEIVPLYYASAIDSDGEYYYYGVAYTYEEGDEIYYGYLPDGDYYYYFTIDDTYGDYFVTDGVFFLIEDGEIYYYTD